MSESIGPKIELQGEKEYRNAINNINKEMKVLTSEMKATSAEFDGNANSIDALKKKSEILNKEYDEQTKKVKTLQGALENAKTVYGENSNQVKDWQIKLNNAEAELSKLDKELKTNDKYLDEAKKSTDGTAKSIDEFGKEVKTAGTETLKTGDIIKANLTSEAIIQGVKALGSAMKDVAKGAVDLTVDAAAYADDIMTMSIQTGIATDKLQAYNYMAELTDTSLEDMTKTMAKNVKSMYSAQTGSKNFKDAYEKLNVEFEDANGNLRDNEDVYWELIDALGEMENKTEADALAMQLFGKSARDLNPLIAVGSKGVAEFTKEAKEMGAILDDETLSSLGDADDAFQRLKQSVDIAKRAVGAEMAPAFEEAAEKITTKVVGMSDEFAEFAGDALNLAVDGLSWVLDNGDKVAGVIGGIGVGMMAFKIGGVISTGMAEAVKAWKAYKIAADGAKISQAGLNAAMATNPITLVATAVGVLAGAMITYSLSTDDAKWGTTEWSRALDKATKSAEELNKQIVESKEARDKNTKKIEAEHGAVQKLSNELFALAEQGDKSAASQEKMKLLVSELNKSMPELSLAFNEQTGELNMQKGEVDKLISSYLEMAKVEAAQESLKEVLKEQYEAEKQLQELQEKKPETLGEIMTSYTGIYDFLKDDYGKQLKATEENVAALKEEEKQIVDYIIKNTPAAGQVVDEFGNTVDESAEQISQANQETIESLQKMQEEYEKTLDDTADEIYNSMSLFDEFAKNTEISGETLLKNLQSQVDGMEEWSENLQELSKKGIEEGLLQELYDMGPAAAGEIQALNDMTDEQLQEYNDTWREKTKLSREIAEAETAGMRKDIEKELEKLPKEAEAVGENSATNLGKGITNNSGKAIEAAEAMMKGSTAAAETEGAKMNTVGKSMVDGLIAGLRSKDGELRFGVAAIATTTLNVMKQKLDIHSPSRVMKKEVGEQIANGVIEGIKSKKENAKKSAKELSEIVLSEAKKGLSNYKVYHELSLTEEVDYWNKIRKECKKGTQARIDADEEYYKAKEQLTEKQKALDEEYQENVRKTNENLASEIDKLNKSYDDAVKSRAQSIMGSMGLFENYSFSQDTTGRQLLSNLRSQTRGLQDWISALETLKKRGIGDGLYQELAGMGIDAADEITALNELTNDELNEYVRLWEEKSKLATAQATAELKGLKSETEKQIQKLTENANKELESYYDVYREGMVEIGANISEGLIEGISSKDNKVRKSVLKMADLAVSVTKEKLKIHSPSDVFAELGAFTAEGFGLGFENTMAKVNREMSASLPTDIDVSGGNISSNNLGANDYIISIIENIANRPAIFYLNGREFARATAGDLSVELNNSAVAQMRSVGGRV